jgi:crossover junction endodeoxyribonuclease RusA
MRVTLPYPDSRLSPNARLHWAQKSKLVKSARQAAFVLSRHAGVTPAETVGQIDVSITMYAPDRRAATSITLSPRSRRALTAWLMPCASMTTASACPLPGASPASLGGSRS